MSDGHIPVIINLAGQTGINEVVLVDENIASFEELCTYVYEIFRPAIPEFYLQHGERHITKMWIDWNRGSSNFLPRDTPLCDANLKAVLRMYAMRGGVDMIRVWLNEIDES